MKNSNTIPTKILSRLVDPKRTAVLVIDIQHDFCCADGKLAKQAKLDTSTIEKMIVKLDRFLPSARSAGVPVIFTQMMETPKFFPENLRLKKRVSKTPKAMLSLCDPRTIGFRFYHLSPHPGDLKIRKTTFDVFSNPQLERFLKRRRIKNLIVTGVYTAFCVDATVRSAFTRGYHVVVPKELVAMMRQQQYLHRAALEVWELLFAHVVPTKSILAAWKNKAVK